MTNAIFKSARSPFVDDGGDTALVYLSIDKKKSVYSDIQKRNIKYTKKAAYCENVVKPRNCKYHLDSLGAGFVSSASHPAPKKQKHVISVMSITIELNKNRFCFTQVFG